MKRLVALMASCLLFSACSGSNGGGGAPGGGPAAAQRRTLSGPPKAGDLVRAARDGDLELAQLLIDAGADVNENTGDANDQLAPLLTAAAFGRDPIVDLLKAHGARESASYQSYTAEELRLFQGGQLAPVASPTPAPEMSGGRLTLNGFKDALAKLGNAATVQAGSETWVKEPEGQSFASPLSGVPLGVDSQPSVFGAIRVLRLFADRESSGLGDTRFSNANFASLVNPEAWSTAAEGYLALYSGNSQAYQFIADLPTLTKVIENGSNLQAFVAALSAPATGASGERALPKYLEGIFDDYARRLDELKARLGDARGFYEGLYLGGASMGEASGSSGGDKAQPDLAAAARFTPPASMPPCESARDATSSQSGGVPQQLRFAAPRVPEAVIAALPPSLKAAHQLGIGRLNFCYVPGWREVRTVTEAVGAGLSVRHLGRPTLTVQVSYSPQGDAARINAKAQIRADKPYQDLSLDEVIKRSGTSRFAFSGEQPLDDARLVDFREDRRDNLIMQPTPHFYSVIEDYNAWLSDNWSALCEAVNVSTRKAAETPADNALVADDVRNAKASVRALYAHDAAVAVAGGNGVRPLEAFTQARASLVEASGVRQLLQAYIKLGFSRSYAKRDELRASFSGERALPPEEELATNVGQNVSLATTDAKARANALRAILAGVVADPRLDESYESIETTLRGLDTLKTTLLQRSERAPISDVFKRYRAAVQAL